MSEYPRWRLISPHYLNVPVLPDGTQVEWEHKETNKQNGRAVRKLFAVPLFLNPDDPNDYNYPGEIIVAQEAEGVHTFRDDIIFIGAPTRDMEPLNAAAQAITDQHSAKWTHPIDTLPPNGGMNDQEKAFFENMMKAFAAQSQVAQTPNTSVPRENYDKLLERLTNLEALIAAQNNPPAPIGGNVARRA